METLQAKIDGPIYPWVYLQVRDSHAAIGNVLRNIGLTDAFAGTGST